MSLKASNPLLLESPLSPLSDGPSELALDADLLAGLDELPEEDLPEELLPLPDPDPLSLFEPLLLFAMNCPDDARASFHPNPGWNVHSIGQRLPIARIRDTPTSFLHRAGICAGHVQSLAKNNIGGNPGVTGRKSSFQKLFPGNIIMLENALIAG